MEAAQTEKIYTVADYLRLERKTGRKYAFYNGKIEPMAGGTIPHNTVSANIFGLLHHFLFRKQEYQVFGSDQKIYLPKFNFYVYPDAVVIAGEPLVTDKEADAIINPLLIVETLSKSSERYDRGQKFVEYQSLPSFREYVLIRQDAPEVYLQFREEPNLWRTSEVIGLEGEVYFRSIEARIPIADIYYKMQF